MGNIVIKLGTRFFYYYRDHLLGLCRSLISYYQSIILSHSEIHLVTESKLIFLPQYSRNIRVALGKNVIYPGLLTSKQSNCGPISTILILFEVHLYHNFPTIFFFKLLFFLTFYLLITLQYLVYYWVTFPYLASDVLQIYVNWTCQLHVKSLSQMARISWCISRLQFGPMKDIICKKILYLPKISLGYSSTFIYCHCL